MLKFRNLHIKVRNLISSKRIFGYRRHPEFRTRHCRSITNSGFGIKNCRGPVRVGTVKEFGSTKTKKCQRINSKIKCESTNCGGSIVINTSLL